MDGVSQFKCSYYTFSMKGNLKLHEESKHYVCPYCGKQSTTKFSLNMHFNNIHKVKKFECDQCDKKFLHHNQRVHIQRKYPFKCKTFEFQTTTRRKLSLHIANVYSKETSELFSKTFPEEVLKTLILL